MYYDGPKLQHCDCIAISRSGSIQKGFEEQKRSSNLAFKRWAICVASIYGLLMCLVVGLSALLVVSAQPNTPTLTGYSPRASQVPPVTTRHDL
jgi:hypothetical protein